MKFSPVKYTLTVAAIVISAILAILAVCGQIPVYWACLSIIIVGFGKTYLWYLTIPFGKAKEEAALERVLAQTGEDNA